MVGSMICHSCWRFLARRWPDFMAVFTELNQADVEQILEAYPIGGCISLQPIGEGIENTNYFLDTLGPQGEKRQWVLTLFENLNTQELPYFARLTEHLANAGFTVPAPVHKRDSGVFFRARDRDGIIVPRLKGRAKKQVGESECAALGCWLAEMHCSLQGFQGDRPLVRNLDWMRRHCQALVPFLSSALLRELQDAIARYEVRLDLLNACPQGTVHGDLFRDNVLFEDGKISGVIDFYNASNATLLYDLAVAANDWTMDAGNLRNADRLAAMENAYQAVRPWTDEEKNLWPYLLELAALRFWISRLVSYYASGYQSAAVSGQGIKDPEQMRQLMRLCRESVV